MSTDCPEIEIPTEVDLTPEELMSLASESAREYEADAELSQDLAESEASVKLINKGLRIYETIILVEQTLRDAESRDEFDFTRELQDSMIEIYATWLHGASKTLRGIQAVSSGNPADQNLPRFRSVIDRVERSVAARVARREKYKSITGAMLRALAEKNPPHPSWYEGEEDG